MSSRARRIRLRHEFVRHIPEELEDGTLYISIDFATAAHKCFCGCGNEVVTPFSPTQWALIFEGVSVSLRPSVGNWSYDCKSHYWIHRNRVVWGRQLSEEEIAFVRAQDRRHLDTYFERKMGTQHDQRDADRPVDASGAASGDGE